MSSLGHLEVAESGTRHDPWEDREAGKLCRGLEGEVFGRDGDG
jgi:hypothetical protein